MNFDQLKIAAGNKFCKKEVKLFEEIDLNWKYLANFENAFNHTSNLALIVAAFIYNSKVKMSLLN